MACTISYAGVLSESNCAPGKVGGQILPLAHATASPPTTITRNRISPNLAALVMGSLQHLQHGHRNAQTDDDSADGPPSQTRLHLGNLNQEFSPQVGQVRLGRQVLVGTFNPA